jgi:hypothetical protein
MLRLLADENLDGNIIRGLMRRLTDVDLVRVQDVGLSGADDPAVLEWAAGEGRVVVTHDVATMTRFAYERVGAGLSMPGVIEIVHSASIGQAIDELLFVVEYHDPGDMEGQVLYLPL